MGISNSWYVLYVRSKQENKVYQSLKEKGLDVFLPMTTVIREWSDRKKKLKVPLFSSYVFVNINSKMDFYMATSADGACTFIKFGKEYAVVKKSEIENIRRLVSMDGIKDLQSNYSLPHLGETMKISYGPLEGLKCKVERVDDNFKIQVSINSLRQSIYATIPLSFLTPYSSCLIK
ncbi:MULTISPECIES: UpxY family transcription antiterminator [Aquimarina]|uniref:UpxY family transcription antiterminator n=1 Tax=Aquimarina TaxID=290174 RepID=UPI000D698D57|nr:MULTISPECIES: UpxY family transcription antiterminator [Aquimarina]